VYTYLQTPVQTPVSQEFDSTLLSLRQNPAYRYPGRALMYSLVVPGGGQIYLGQWKRALLYLVFEGAAVIASSNYNKQGQSQVKKNKAYANTNWDFSDWIRNAIDFNPPGSEDEEIEFGADGSHSLDFYIDNDGDDIPNEVGSTKDYTQSEMLALVNLNDGYIFVMRNGEYYENIGKYNQFHTGWQDYADSAWVESTASGPRVHSDNRDYYLGRRTEANRLLTAARYMLSALMFNHVISGVDGIFTAARKNRKLEPICTARSYINRIIAVVLEQSDYQLIYK
jgi:hypothetical protein